MRLTTSVPRSSEINPNTPTSGVVGSTSSSPVHEVQVGGLVLSAPTPQETVVASQIHQAEQDIQLSPRSGLLDQLTANGRKGALVIADLMTERIPQHLHFGQSDGIDFTVFSFGQKPTQSIAVVDKAPVNSDRYLGRTTATEVIAGGGVVAEIGRMSASKVSAFTHSLGPCTAVCSFYPDGSMLLFHLSSFDEDELHKTIGKNDGSSPTWSQATPLPSGSPTDVFIVAKHQHTQDKTGKDLNFNKQGGVIKELLSHELPCNIHIVHLEVASYLAVKMTPGHLECWTMN